MSDAYDSLPDAVRTVREALLDPQRVAEAVPLALQLLAHGWTKFPSDGQLSWEWADLGVAASMWLSTLFPDELRYALLVEAPSAEDHDTIRAAREMAQAAAEGLDLLAGAPCLADHRRRELVSAAAGLRAIAGPQRRRWEE